MRVIEVDDYDRALGNGFVAREETRERWERDKANFRDHVTRHRGHDYLERFDNRSRAVDIDTLARRAVAVGRGLQSAFKGDMIYALTDVGDFQQAGERMQDYLLAVPEINYKARNNRMEAWMRSQDTYAYGKDEDYRNNPYYRAMMDGFMVVDEDDPTSMVAESFLGQTEDDMETLSHDEQITLHRNAALMLDLLNGLEGEDPSSKLNNVL